MALSKVIFNAIQILALLISVHTISSCQNVKRFNAEYLSDKSFILYGKYVDYNCNPLSGITTKASNRVSTNNLFSAGYGFSSLDTTNEAGDFELKLYQGHIDSTIFINDSIHTVYNNVHLNHIKKITSEQNRILFYEPYVNDNYYLTQEYKNWIRPAGRSNGTSIYDYISVDPKIINDDKGNEYLKIKLQGRDGGWRGTTTLQVHETKFTGQIPTSGYKPEETIDIILNSISSNKWNQYVVYIKSDNNAAYGVYNLDIIDSKYSYLGSPAKFLWVNGQMLITSKKYNTNGDIVPAERGHGNATPVAIAHPFIPTKKCGKQPDLQNSQFQRHPRLN